MNDAHPIVDKCLPGVFQLLDEPGREKAPRTSAKSLGPGLLYQDNPDPRGHWAMLGDICGHHNCRCSWLQAGEAALVKGSKAVAASARGHLPTFLSPPCPLPCLPAAPTAADLEEEVERQGGWPSTADRELVPPRACLSSFLPDRLSQDPLTHQGWVQCHLPHAAFLDSPHLWGEETLLMTPLPTLICCHVLPTPSASPSPPHPRPGPGQKSWLATPQLPAPAPT